MARIMIVDDEQDVATLVRFMLEKMGHSVACAANGADALEQLGVEPANPAAEPFDLLLIDVMMPVMDGCTVVSRLSQNPRLRSTPAIVLTAKGEMRGAFTASPNVAACLDKPFDPQRLRELVASILDRRAGARHD